MFNKITTIGFFLSILAFILVIPIIFIGFLEGKIILYIIIACLYLIVGSILFKYTYSQFLFENSAEKFCQDKN